MKTSCLNCGHEFKVTKVFNDELGLHTTCPKCDSSFDVDVTLLELTEDEFHEQFNFVKNHIDDNAAFGGCMFETYGTEIDYILDFAKENPKRVWTIIEAEERMYYSAGYHLVNRLGYLITEEEFVCETDVKLENLNDDMKYKCTICGEYFDEHVDEKCPFCGSETFEINNENA